MMNISYTFYKDGKKYSIKGANRFEAQENIKLQWCISLMGVTFEEMYKLHVVRTGKVR